MTDQTYQEWIEREAELAQQRERDERQERFTNGLTDKDFELIRALQAEHDRRDEEAFRTNRPSL